MYAPQKKDQRIHFLCAFLNFSKFLYWTCFYRTRETIKIEVIKTLLLFKWPVPFCPFTLCFSLWNNTSINKDKAFQPYIAFSGDEGPQVVINNHLHCHPVCPLKNTSSRKPLAPSELFSSPGSYPPLLSEAARGAGEVACVFQAQHLVPCRFKQWKRCSSVWNRAEERVAGMTFI